MTLFVVRHAHAGSRSAWTGDDRLRPLSDRGESQARGIAELIVGRAPSVILSSPAMRCVQTVASLAEKLDLEVTIDERLFEGVGPEEVRSLVARRPGHGVLQPRRRDPDGAPAPRRPRHGPRTSAGVAEGLDLGGRARRRALGNRHEQARVIVCLILFMAAALFWASFEQQPTSYNLFASDYTNRQVMGFDIPVLWFQSLNPLFIIVLAPLFGWLWPAMARRGFEPSSVAKFGAGLVFAAAGFGLMVMAAWQVVDGAGLVSPLWIVASLLLLTLGELCLSPVGLSTMTELAPMSMRGQIMGIWFAASALGNLVAGLIGGHVSPEHVTQLPELFGRCALALLIGAVILMILIKPIRRLLAHSRTAKSGTSETPQ